MLLAMVLNLDSILHAEGQEASTSNRFGSE